MGLTCVSAPLMDCGGGELSDGSSSGYWSVGHGNGSPAPSPTVTSATPPDEGLDMELEEVLFEEPAARKRRVSTCSGLHTANHAAER